jgi:DNA polymerase
VDALVDEQPRDWLAPIPRTPQAPPVAEKHTSPEAHATPTPAFALPTSATDLVDWYLKALLPGAGPSGQRIAPAGSLTARLMVLVDMPEAEDISTGVLLSGEAGALFDKMLGALGFTRDAIWFAPMLPTRIAGGAIPPEEMAQLDEITRHHVGLIRPAKLWLLGRAASRAILGMDEGPARGRLHKFNHNGTTTDVIASVHPRVLLQTPKRKAEVWADMQRLIED